MYLPATVVCGVSLIGLHPTSITQLLFDAGDEHLWLESTEARVVIARLCGLLSEPPKVLESERDQPSCEDWVCALW